ncbi:hypothetical protein [Chitinophaga varians]|uniref:glycine-rich domain-containing protein n=1 Tax=Chitinophaga varians TaxID=2202339 RepID=UPI00165F0358|nr:hypothetical protein [Chitinophaga varians]MBC9909139.1 hypothetical protein [Chitinophaga varians]
MKKILFSIFPLFISSCLLAQKPSYVEHSPINWSDSMPAITRIVKYQFTGNPIIANLPPDAKYCIIEAWGGGGMGTTAGGGGGGGYVIAKFRKAGGSAIEISIGNAGMRDANNRIQDGGNTVVSFPGGRIIANGGGAYRKGGLYSIEINSSDATAYGVNGENGGTNLNTDLIIKGDSSVIYRLVGGVGGNAGNSVNTGGQGGDLILVGQRTTDASFIHIDSYILGGKKEAANGISPGGGGGGVAAFYKKYTVPYNDPSTTGAAGMVIIYY